MEKLIIIIPTQKNIKAIIEVEKGLDNKLKIEEAWWSQRAKSVQLLEGDKKRKISIKESNQRKKDTI